MELNTSKIVKIEVYDKKDRFLGVTRVFEVTEVKIKKNIIKTVTINFNNIINMHKGDTVMLVFEVGAGTRYKTIAELDSVTKTQIVITLGEVEELEERRRSFKVSTDETAVVYKSKAADAEGLDARILNINLGGVLLKCEEKLSVGSTIYLSMLSGDLELPTKILRKQKDLNGNLVGYGCQFVEVDKSEEEILSKHILQCQILERERRKTLEDMGLN